MQALAFARGRVEKLRRFHLARLHRLSRLDPVGRVTMGLQRLCKPCLEEPSVQQRRTHPFRRKARTTGGVDAVFPRDSDLFRGV